MLVSIIIWQVKQLHSTTSHVSRKQLTINLLYMRVCVCRGTQVSTNQWYRWTALGWRRVRRGTFDPLDFVEWVRVLPPSRCPRGQPRPPRWIWGGIVPPQVVWGGSAPLELPWGGLWTEFYRWLSPKSSKFSPLAPAALAEKYQTFLGLGSAKNTCIREPARLAQSYFWACTRAVPFEIDVFMTAEHMQRIFVHKNHMCFEQTRNSLLAIFANVKWKDQNIRLVGFYIFQENITKNAEIISCIDAPTCELPHASTIGANMVLSL